MITPDEANAISEMADKQRRDKRRLFLMTYEQAIRCINE